MHILTTDICCQKGKSRAIFGFLWVFCPKMVKKLSTHLPAILILIASMAIGMAIYQDFGISIDEVSQREIGRQTYAYAIGQNPGYINFALRDHGPGFEWLYIFFEKALSLDNFRDIFLMRHLVTYMTFILSMFCGYLWAIRIFGNRWLATITLFSLIFSPTIFGHAFFNPKDVPAMSIFLVSLYFTHRSFSVKKWQSFLLLGIIVGFSCTVRLTNAVILAPIALFLAIDMVTGFLNKEPISKIFTHGLTVLAGTALALYAFWPALWADPIAGLRYVFASNANYDWISEVQFSGTLIYSNNLPWSYIPTWMAITTPELFIILGLIGIALFITRLVSQGRIYFLNTAYRGITLAAIAFFLPLIIVIRLNATLYDAWRHMYFIYPPFIIMATYGLGYLAKYWHKAILLSLCGAQALLIFSFMIDNHPFEHVYFNHFVSHKRDYLMKHYELEYWGTSHKYGLEWIAAHDERYGIKVFNSWTVGDNHQFLNKDFHSKFIITDITEEADYFIEFFRTAPMRFPDKNFPEAKLVHEKRVLNSPIYRITKMR